jgi:hypothetical protein
VEERGNEDENSFKKYMDLHDGPKSSENKGTRDIKVVFECDNLTRTLFCVYYLTQLQLLRSCLSAAFVIVT